MPTIEPHKSLRVSQAVGPMWDGKLNAGRYWILEPSNLDGVPDLYVRPDGNTQPTAWWFDDRAAVDEAVAIYGQKHRSADWHEKLVDLVANCIDDQQNGFDALASSSWDRVVDHWGPNVADVTRPGGPES